MRYGWIEEDRAPNRQVKVRGELGDKIHELINVRNERRLAGTLRVTETRRNGSDATDLPRGHDSLVVWCAERSCHHRKIQNAVLFSDLNLDVSGSSWYWASRENFIFGNSLLLARRRAILEARYFLGFYKGGSEYDRSGPGSHVKRVNDQ